MKSSFRISVAAIGLVASVLLSAAVAPAAEKIAPIDYIVEDSQHLSGQTEFFEQIETVEIGNDFELLEVAEDDKELRPSVSKKKETETSQAASVQQASSSKEQASSQQKPSSSQQSSSQKPSSQPSSQQSSNNATSAQKPSSSAAGVTADPNIKVQSKTVSPAYCDENGNEILKFSTNGTTYSLPVKEALKRIVSNEMNENMNYEAIKAQVVATHTYVKYYNDTKSIPSLGSKTSYKKGSKIDRAVEEVYNIIATYNGKAIFSPYHASAAGRTQSSKEVWGGARAYLVSVESKYDYLADYQNGVKTKSNYLAYKTVSEATVKSKIQNSLGVSPSGDPSTWFKFMSETSGGYVKNISVCGKTTTGEKMRTMFGLRSACFEISYKNGSFTFTTRGYGHGVGLSQWGAHYYAVKENWNYQQIICHYFTGVSIAKVA